VALTRRLTPIVYHAPYSTPQAEENAMQKHPYIAAVLTAALIALAPAVSTQANAEIGGSMVLPDSKADMDPSDAYAQSDYHRSRLKQALKLSVEQEKLWAPVEEAFANLREQRRDLRSAITPEPTDQIERLRRRAEMITQQADALKKLADAVQPLWMTFSEEQKRELAQRLLMGPRQSDQERRISRRQDDDGGIHHRPHGWHHKDQDRAYRDRRDYRDRMMRHRGYVDDDDDTRRGRFDRFQHRWSHDDYGPRARRFDRDRYDYDHHTDRDYCRCDRRH
jgi:hypothetical protein